QHVTALLLGDPRRAELLAGRRRRDPQRTRLAAGLRQGDAVVVEAGRRAVRRQQVIEGVRTAAGVEPAVARASRRPLVRVATPYLYIAPALAIYGCFTLVPLGHTVWLSFFTWDGITHATWHGIGNYRTIASDPQLRAVFWHPFVLIVFYSLIPILLGVTIAATMTRIRVHGLT